MKILVVSFFFLLVCMQLKGQSCSYEKNETDEFTGSKILLTSPVTFLNFSEKMKCSLSRINTENFFVLEFTTGKSLYNIEKEDLIYFIFDDGSKVTFEPVDLVTFSEKIHGYNNIKVVYSIGDLMPLQTSEINKMRVTTSDGFFDYEIKKSKAKRFFKDNLVCIK